MMKQTGIRLAAATAVLVLALALRWHGIDAAGCYPDEGDVAEVCATLAAHGPMAVGAVRQSAFFPLSSSPIVPILASGFIRAGGWDTLAGLRRWSACMAALAAAGILLLLWARQGPAWGLAGGLVYAVHPLAVYFGQRGFYHHFGALLSVACLALALRYRDRPSPARALALGLACGIAVASAYWLLWLLLFPPLLFLFQGRKKDVAWALPGLLLPLGLVAAWSLAMDPAGFWGDVHELLSQTQADIPMPLLERPFYSLYHSVLAFPALGFALLGLVAWAWSQRAEGLKSGALWVLAWALACGAEVFRQRQNLDAFPYPLILVFGPMAVGCGALAGLAWDAARARSLLRVPALLCVLGMVWGISRTPDLMFINRLSLPAADTAAMLEQVRRLARPGDVVLGQPTFDWSLAGSGIRAADLEQAAVWEGERSSFLRGDLPHTRFTFDPHLEGAKLMVFSPFTYGISLFEAGPRRLVLRAEMGRWRKLWSNQTYEIFGNPALGFAPAQPVQPLMRYYNLYDSAAGDAIARRDWTAALWALRIADTSRQGDLAARKRLMVEVQGEIKAQARRP
jgi:hypothetical protein